jgi:hypothetical protein
MFPPFVGTGTQGAPGNAAASLTLTATSAGASANGSADANAGYGAGATPLGAVATSVVTAPYSATSAASSTGGSNASGPGSASATATAIGTQANAGPVTAFAQAQSVNQLTNLGGVTTAVASSHSIGNSAGSAQSSAWGGSGTATAQSTAVDSLGTQSFVATASAPASTRFASVLSQATVAGQWYGPPASTSNGQAAYASVLGSPTSTAPIFDAGTAPRTAAAFAGASVVAAGVLGANDDGTTGAPVTYSASTEQGFFLSGDSQLTLSLVDFAGYGDGFSKLTFSVSDDGRLLLSDTFTSFGAAESFFTDNPLLLSASSGEQDLTLALQYMGNGPGGAGFSYALGISSPISVPEPPTWLLLILGLSGLMYRRVAAQWSRGPEGIAPASASVRG